MRLEKPLILVLCALLAIVCGCWMGGPDASQETGDTVAAAEGATDGNPARGAAEPDADQSTADIEAGPGGSEGTTGDEAEPAEGFTNSIGMEFKLIPAGEFMMGSPEDERDHQGGETQHRACIAKPYYLGVYEVTQGQWEVLMGTRPWEGSAKSGSEYAVTHVSWYDAVEFCGKLSEKEGREYRLPTEAQWEYACRAGTTTRFCFGDDDSDLRFYAWCKERDWESIHSSVNSVEAYTHIVGLKRANAWGLYDMHGNVCEWCWDWHGEDYYGNSPMDDPAGPSTGSNRVVRGGCWYGIAMMCRSAFRASMAPDYQSSYVGFRVAQVPAE